MGQQITVSDPTVVGDVAVFSTDRSITGQDGASIAPTQTGGGIPEDLAARLVDADAAITHVFVASNQVVVGRSGGWDEGSLTVATDVIAGFFVFYGA